MLLSGFSWNILLAIFLHFYVDILKTKSKNCCEEMCKPNGLKYSSRDLIRLNGWNNKGNVSVAAWTRIKDLGFNVPFIGTRGGINVQRPVKTVETFRHISDVGQCGINPANLIQIETITACGLESIEPWTTNRIYYDSISMTLTQGVN